MHSFGGATTLNSESGQYTGMDVWGVIRTRISVRAFTDEEVSDANKREILDAGRLSQSGHNSQHWRPILVDDPAALERLAELSHSGEWVANAAFAVVIATDPERHYHEIDAGRIVTHMQFAAWDRGLGSCIFTALDDDGYRAFLEIPDELAIPVVVGFGYPTFDIDDLQGKKDRKPLESVASYGSFGEPLPWTE